MTLSVNSVDYVLTNTAGVVLQSSSGQTMTVIKATVCNTDTNPHTVTVYRVPSGSSAAASNLLVDAMAVPAGATLALPISGQPITQGQSWQALASTGALVNLSMGYLIEQ